MKANELMIDDWVLCTHYEDKPFYKQFGLGDFVKGDYSFCEPIPLTDEILRKNGFQYFHKNFCSLSYDHPFKLEMEQWPDENGLGGLWTICGIIEIRFVHQLQHALRLCGIEKTIEL